MRFSTTRRLRWALAALAACSLAATACSAGSLGSSDSKKGSVKVETRPQGADGDNVVKTRLSTGDMDDVFEYNSGSLFQRSTRRRTSCR